MLRKLSNLIDLWRKDRREYLTPPPGPKRSERRFTPLSSDWSQELAAPPGPAELGDGVSSEHRLIAVGSGKGGVGKTIIASSLEMSHSQLKVRGGSDHGTLAHLGLHGQVVSFRHLG